MVYLTISLSFIRDDPESSFTATKGRSRGLQEETDMMAIIVDDSSTNAPPNGIVAATLAKRASPGSADDADVEEQHLFEVDGAACHSLLSPSPQIFKYLYAS